MPRAADISWYFVNCLSASDTLAQVQPRITSLDLDTSTFLQLQVLGTCQHGWICCGTWATPLPAPAAWPGYYCYALGQKKKRVRNLWIMNSWDDTWRWAREKVVTLHGVLAGGSRGLMCSSKAGKEQEFGLFWLLPAEIWGCEQKFNGP